MPHIKHGLQKSPDSLFNCQRPRPPKQPGPPWRSVVSLGKLRPLAHCVNIFFSTFRVAVATRPCPGFPYAEERFYAASRGPSTLFFNLRPIRFRVLDKRLRFPEAEELSSQPRPARQHFFSSFPCRRCGPDPRPGFPSRGGVSLRPATGTVNTFFFNVPPGIASRKNRPGSPQRGMASTDIPPGRQHVF